MVFVRPCSFSVSVIGMRRSWVPIDRTFSDGKIRSIRSELESVIYYPSMVARLSMSFIRARTVRYETPNCEQKFRITALSWTASPVNRSRRSVHGLSTGTTRNFFDAEIEIGEGPVQ